MRHDINSTKKTNLIIIVGVSLLGYYQTYINTLNGVILFLLLNNANL